VSKRPKSGASRQQQQAAAQARRRHRPGPTAVAAARRGPVESAPSQEAPPAVAPARSSPPSVPFYVDVAAVRIQEWLGRTPSLKFRRGASVLLTEATRRDQWLGSLPDGVVWNDEAGELPGVVSLKVLPEFPPTAHDAGSAAGAGAGAGSAVGAGAGASVVGTSQVVAREAARRVVSGLRAALPHCAFQAVGASGATYVDAYRGIARARRQGDLLVDSPAPPAEVVLAKPCDLCLQAAATGPAIRVVDRDRFVCGECARRFDAAGGTKGSWHDRSPAPERRMRDAVQALRPQVSGFSDDFVDMARAGGLEPDDAPTHLALVYADGNKVGAFLTRVCRWAEEHGRPAKSDIVVTIDNATVSALAAAVVATFVDADLTGVAEDPERAAGYAVRPPVLAHVAGGDDLMISVPAPFGWPLVRHLLAGFDHEIRRAAAGWGLRQSEELPSLSAGVVFHHHTHPFSDVVLLATAQLKVAKQEFRGEEAAVAFVDLTSDGDRAPAGRRPVSTGWLDRTQDLLSRLAVVAPSQRETLGALHRQSTEPDSAVGDRETAVEALARRAVDLGSPAVWEVVAGPDAAGEQVRTLLTADGEARTRLRAHLDLARWWPPRVVAPTAATAAPEES
jgi:hypothetical protein